MGKELVEQHFYKTRTDTLPLACQLHIRQHEAVISEFHPYHTEGPPSTIAEGECGSRRWQTITVNRRQTDV